MEALAVRASICNKVPQVGENFDAIPVLAYRRVEGRKAGEALVERDRYLARQVRAL